MVDTANAPTGHDIRAYWMEEYEGDPAFRSVHKETEPDDDGYAVSEVFERLSDGTFWMVHYVSQNEGSYNSLRDYPRYTGVVRVYPHTVTRTEYLTTPQEEV